MEGVLQMRRNTAVAGKDCGYAARGRPSNRPIGKRGALSSVTILAAAIVGLSSSAAGAAPRHSAPAPVIFSFSGRPQSLPYRGGNATFVARLKFASSCTISVSPRISGLPATVGCKSQSFARKVAIPKHSGSPLSYTFQLRVKGSGGAVTAPNVVITVGAAPPPVTFSPSSVRFGDEGVGIPSAPLTVTVTNNSATTQTSGKRLHSTGPRDRHRRFPRHRWELRGRSSDASATVQVHDLL